MRRRRKNLGTMSWVGIGAGVLGIGGLVWWLVARRKASAAGSGASAGGGEMGPPAPTPPPSNQAAVQAGALASIKAVWATAPQYVQAAGTQCNRGAAPGLVFTDAGLDRDARRAAYAPYTHKNAAYRYSPAQVADVAARMRAAMQQGQIQVVCQETGG